MMIFKFKNIDNRKKYINQREKKLIKCCFFFNLIYNFKLKKFYSCLKHLTLNEKEKL